MKIRDFKSINFSKSGAGNTVGKIILPKKWLEDMNIDAENSWVELFYDKNEKKIFIEKKK